MSIIKYVSSLLPNFKKDRLLEDIRIVKSELQNNSIPAYKAAMEVFTNNKPKAVSIQNYQNEYFKLLGATNTKGMIIDIAQRLQNLDQLVVKIENVLDKEFENEILAEGLDLYKSSILKTVELIGFISRYNLRFLNYCYSQEMEAVTSDKSPYREHFSKGDLEKITKGFATFARGLRILTTGHKDFVEQIKGVPHLLVNKNSEAALATFPLTKLDPTGIMQLQFFTYNPIYHLGLMVAEWQSVRYKEQQELKLNLELRLMNLKMARESGLSDPSLDKEIEITQSRVDKISEKLRKTEESVGI